MGLGVRVRFGSNCKLGVRWRVARVFGKALTTSGVGLPSSLLVVNFGGALGLNVLASLLSSMVFALIIVY